MPKKLLLLGLIVLALGITLVGGQSPVKAPAPSGSTYQRGSDALKKGDADTAISNYTAAIAIDQKNASAYAGRGAAKRLKGDYHGALLDLNTSIELNPTVQSSFYTRAWINLILGHGDDAFADATKLLSFSESNHLVFPSHVLIAYFGLRQSKRDAEAEMFLRNAFPKLFSGASTTQIARYLKRELTEEQLFAAAAGSHAMIEARTYVGLDQSLNGKKEAALNNFRWVVVNGEKRAFEYSLAQSQIIRLTSPVSN